MLSVTLTIPSSRCYLFQSIFVFCLLSLVQIPAPEIVSGEHVRGMTEKETHQIPIPPPPIAFSVWMRRLLIFCRSPLSFPGSCNSTFELIFLFFLPLLVITCSASRRDTAQGTLGSVARRPLLIPWWRREGCLGDEHTCRRQSSPRGLALWEHI